MTVSVTDKIPLDKNRYLIEESIGRGGEGAVYRAYDKSLQRKVAIKLIPYEDKAALVEARAIARCDSPYVIQVYDVAHDDNYLCIVMELVEGNDTVTSESITDMAADRFHHFFSQVLEAVSSIHSSGLLHLDLKPSNILVDKEERVKVTDFGISVLKDTTRFEKSPMATHRKGSWYCLSPEQLTQQPVSEATDVFALGVLLYTSLFKIHPFLVPGDAATSRDNIIRGKLLRSPRNLRDEEAPLAELAEAMLSKDPAMRPSLVSVTQLISITYAKIFDNDTSPITQEIPVASPSRVSVLQRWKWLLAVASLVVVIAAALFLWLSQWQRVMTTLVVPTLKIENPDNPTAIRHQDNNLLVATLIEDEVEAAVISDPRRRLVSKKEWRGTRNWGQEAKQVDVDEIVISEVACGTHFCDVYLSIYNREKDEKTHLVKQSIPHSSLMVLSQVVEQLLVTQLDFQSKKKFMGDISDEDLRLYVDYMTKVETRTISKADIADLVVFSKRNPGFLGAQLVLGKAYIALYSKEADDDWLQKSRELLVKLTQRFPDSPSVLQLKFRNQILSNDLFAAKKSLEKLKGVAGIDTHQLFLSENKLNFKLNNREAIYKKFIAQQQIRLTHGYFHEKAYMELNLNYMQALEATSREWIQLFPDSDVALSFLGNAQMGLGQLNRSIETYQQLTEKNEHRIYYINLAASQLLAGKYTDSIRTMEKVFLLFPVSSYDYLSLGEAHKAANTGEEEVFFLKALESYQSSAGENFGHEALILAHLGRADEAKIALQKTARTQMNDSWFYYYAAQVYSLINEPNPAQFNGKKALDSGFAVHWFNLPWLQPLYTTLIK